MSTKLDKFFTDQGLRPMGTLAHWGVKGMMWGIRRSDAELARASSDAVRAAETQKAISKAKSLSAVSDADLNQLINRINTETRYKQATTASSLAENTHSKIKTLLSVGDTMNKAYTFSQSPAGKILAHKFGFKTIASGPGKHRG